MYYATCTIHLAYRFFVQPLCTTTQCVWCRVYGYDVKTIKRN